MLNYKQKNRAKLLFCVIGIALMLLTTSISMVKAETTQFGQTVAPGGAALATQTNRMFGQTFYTTTWVDEIYTVIDGHAWFTQGVGNQSKMVIVDWNRNILGVSNAVTFTTAGWYNFTFTPTITLYKSSLNYTICMINNGNTLAISDDIGGNNYGVWDSSNSFSTPSSPDLIEGFSNAHNYGFYLDITSDSVSPTTTPTTTAGVTDWNDANSVMSTIVSLILPLCFVLIPAFMGYKFAGAWGFFAGINMGVILCYCFGQIIPLWGVIVMLVVDGLLLFGRVGFRT